MRWLQHSRAILRKSPVRAGSSKGYLAMGTHGPGKRNPGEFGQGKNYVCYSISASFLIPALFVLSLPLKTSFLCCACIWARFGCSRLCFLLFPCKCLEKSDSLCIPVPSCQKREFTGLVWTRYLHPSTTDCGHRAKDSP